MNDSYERLANAIVLQAVKDYRFAMKRLAIYPRNDSALYTKHEIERFFRSDWYALLTTVDPETLIKRLNEEVI